jgi:outer membrane lipoprotein-sorting protein
MRKTLFPVLFYTIVICRVEGQDPKEVLAHVKQVYSNLHAVHVTASVTQEILVGGQSGGGVAEYEFAEKAGGKYAIHSKRGDEESILVSNGTKTWRALPKAKKWSQIEASGMASEDDSEGEAEPDLHANIRSLLVGRYLAVAVKGEQPEFLKQGHYKLGKEKIDCTVLRVMLKNAAPELWIDAGRGLVVQERSPAVSAAALAAPPFAPPSRSRATAAGFSPASLSRNGVPSHCSPMACSTTRVGLYPCCDTRPIAEFHFCA